MANIFNTLAVSASLFPRGLGPGHRGQATTISLNAGDSENGNNVEGNLRFEAIWDLNEAKDFPGDWYKWKGMNDNTDYCPKHPVDVLKYCASLQETILHKDPEKVFLKEVWDMVDSAAGDDGWINVRNLFIILHDKIDFHSKDSSEDNWSCAKCVSVHLFSDTQLHAPN